MTFNWKKFLKPTMPKMLVGFFLFLILPVFQETSCVEAMTGGWCEDYYVPLVSYVGERGLGWIYRNMSSTLRDRLINGITISAILSYFIANLLVLAFPLLFRMFKKRTT
jgi:hypothetical protein